MKMTTLKQDTLDAINEEGSTVDQIAKAMKRTNDNVRDQLLQLEKMGRLFRARVHNNVCFWFKDKAKAIKCLNERSESKKAATLVHIAVKAATKFEADAQIIIPAGVKVQQCPQFRGLGFAEPEQVVGGWATMGVGRYLPNEDAMLRRIARKGA